MMDIFQELVFDSKIPFLRVKLHKEGEIEFIEVLDMNTSFKELSGITEIRDLTNYINGITNKNLRNSFVKISPNRVRTEKYIRILKAYCKIDIYFDDNMLYVQFIEVKKLDKRLPSIIRNSPFIAWVKDLEGTYLDVNEKHLETVNLTVDDIIGKTDFDIWDEEIALKFQAQDELVIKTGEVQIYYDNIASLNKKINNLQTIKWRYEKDNEPIGVIGITIDIKDNKKIRSLIEKAEENFLDLSNNIDELIVIRDEKRALYINQFFEKLYGFKPDALYEDINTWYDYWDSVEFETKPEDYSYKEIDTNILRVKKGKDFDKWIQSKFIPILDEEGNISRKIGLLTDITEKKRIEEELESLRLEFFSNLSHELRTPINIIMSALQVSSINLSLETKQLIDKYLRIINQNSLRLTRLVNNLIDTSKIDSGNFYYNPQNTDIVAFVEDISMSVVEFVEKNNLQLIFDTDVEEKIVAFDLNHMERIILNLVSNSIKFNKTGGNIEITISTEDNVKITVKDNGIGIPKNKIEKIFGRFEQVNKHRRREREGSGIGLSLVKSLVEMHNGTIEVKSKLHKGSEFIITIPDIIVNEDKEGTLLVETDSQVNKMYVEFSDIYC